MGPRPKNTLVLVHTDGAEEGDSFNLGLHTTLLCTKIFTINICVMENTEIGYTCRNIYILSNNQVATKAFGSFQINSKLVWESHQSLVKLAENNRMQLVWVPGNMGIDGNETAYQLATQDSFHPHTGPQPPLSPLQRLPGE